MQNENVKSLRDEIYRQLHEDIIYGRINPGEKLLELELAKRFKVSRTPIREALVQLENQGFIAHEKNVGAVVVRLGPEQVAEYYDVIAVLEKVAAETVAAQKNKKVISRLSDLQKEMIHCAKTKNYLGYLQRDHEFHTFFTLECGNKTLHDIVTELRDRIFTLLERGFTLPAHVDLYLKYHQIVIEAISKGKVSQTGKFMMDHILHAKKFILEEQMRKPAERKLGRLSIAQDL